MGRGVCSEGLENPLIGCNLINTLIRNRNVIVLRIFSVALPLIPHSKPWGLKHPPLASPTFLKSCILYFFPKYNTDVV